MPGLFDDYFNPLQRYPHPSWFPPGEGAGGLLGQLGDPAYQSADFPPGYAPFAGYQHEAVPPSQRVSAPLGRRAVFDVAAVAPMPWGKNPFPVKPLNAQAGPDNFDERFRGGPFEERKPVAAAPEEDPVLDALYSVAGNGLPTAGVQLLGFPGDLRELTFGGYDWLGNKLGIGPVSRYIRPISPLSLLPTSDEVLSGVQSVTGKFYEPRTVYGQYGKAVGEHLPFALLGPASWGRSLLMGVGAGLASEALGQLAEGTGWEPAAHIVGGTLGGVGAAGGVRAIEKTISHLPLRIRVTPGMARHDPGLWEAAKESALASMAVEVGRQRLNAHDRDYRYRTEGADE
jgi:hypothetical protein